MIEGLEVYKNRWSVTSDSSIKPGLESIERALAELGDPHLSVKTVHIAGTNGKGSTAAMLTDILRKHGMTVGNFYSPAIQDVHDQIQLDGRAITEREMDAVFEQLAALRTPLTDFELLTAAAFVAFRDSRLDIAIVEAGMGGRFDSTNVVVPEVAIIPSISKEHTDFLGDTLEEIAWHKGGIIKKWRPVVTGSLPSEAERVIKAIADDQHSDLIRPHALETHSLGLRGDHQRSNAALAYAAAEEILQLGFDRNKALQALEATVLPYRFEERFPGLILDGAHNEASAEALVKTAQAQYPGETFRIVFGILKDKDYKAVLRKLEPIADEFVFVDFDNPRAMPARNLLSECNKSLKTFSNRYDILPLTENKKKTIVTGSLYLLADLSVENSKFFLNYL